MALRQHPTTEPGHNKFEEKTLIDHLVNRGWSVCRDFLPGELVLRLSEEARALWQQDNFRAAGVGGGSARRLLSEIRSDYILWLDPDNLTPLQKSYWEAIMRLQAALNKELFLGLNDFEAHFVVYPPGACYKKHLDQFKQIKERLISCILYLNQHWRAEDGGQLRIYVDADGDDRFIDFLPEAGTFVCFRSDSVYHEVLPAMRERLSLTGWLKQRLSYL